jgi:acyl carrier protein
VSAYPLVRFSSKGAKMNKVNCSDIITIIEQLRIDFDINKVNVKENLDDQGIDSLDLSNILFGIEDVYNIKLDDESIDRGEWLSIEKIVDNLNRILGERNDNQPGH